MAEATSADTSPHSEELGILRRREIEANIIAPIYAILERDLGADRAKAVIREAISCDAVKTGKQFAAREPGGASIKTFADIQHLWEQDDALKTVVLKADETSFHYNVTRCRYAEMYKEKGLGEIGELLSCVRDYEFIKGYAPEVNLTRTQTIMEGARCCDFRYDVAQKPADAD